MGYLLVSSNVDDLIMSYSVTNIDTVTIMSGTTAIVHYYAQDKDQYMDILLAIIL